MAPVIVKPGEIYGSLTVVEEVSPIAVGCRYWIKRRVLVRCSCGSKHIVQLGNLRSGRSTHCKHCQNKTHGHARRGRMSAEYQIWRAILQRCCNPNNKWYPDYGGRGIIVCERWGHNFQNFISDVGCRPNPSLSIDRIDNNGNYEPNNVRWATKSQQNRNKRWHKRPKAAQGLLGI